ncbi:hypothetical protein [Pararhizobium sp. O133]|uniref:hypothetical protein n=1 Tax=Pararhizobium sp. O133 TaxID=3449278 RepID=UPI003F684D99
MAAIIGKGSRLACRPWPTSIDLCLQHGSGQENDRRIEIGQRWRKTIGKCPMAALVDQPPTDNEKGRQKPAL